MKTAIDTVVYRVSGVNVKNYTELQKLEKKYKKVIPQILYMSYSADNPRATDIMVAAYDKITKKQLNSIFKN